MFGRLSRLMKSPQVRLAIARLPEEVRAPTSELRVSIPVASTTEDARANGLDGYPRTCVAQSKPTRELYAFCPPHFVLVKKRELLIPWWLENREHVAKATREVPPQAIPALTQLRLFARPRGVAASITIHPEARRKSCFVWNFLHLPAVPALGFAAGPGCQAQLLQENCKSRLRPPSLKPEL